MKGENLIFFFVEKGESFGTIIKTSRYILWKKSLNDH